MKFPKRISLGKEAPVVAEVPVASARRRMSFNEFSQSFNSLDNQNPGSWPQAVKLTVFLLTALLTLLAGYWFFVRPVQEQINAAQSEQDTLLTQYEDKSNKLRNVKAYQLQVFQLEQMFGQLLQQLPKQNEIPGLVEDINVAGVRAGVQFDSITVKDEVTKELFIELPLEIRARGDYHAFGNFMSNTAALPRILTLHDFSIAPVNTPAAGQPAQIEVPILGMTLNANTYRLNDKADEKDADKKDADKDKPAGSAS